MVARPFKAGIAAPIMRCVAERQLNPDLPIDTNITIVIYSAACDSDIMETARSLLPISAARRPPAIEACLLPCSSCDYLFPSKSFHPLNFLLRFLPCSLL